MRYDWGQKIGGEEFSEAFYKEIDKRAFATVWESMPWKRLPFDALIDFDLLPSQKVLEIGVGMGSHAQLLAGHAGSYTGIDLTNYAAKATSERLRLFELPGDIRQMDAEHLSFSEASFDFIWSWGVIHCSSDIRRVLREMQRVLKTGGKAVVMVYHRGWWNYYICGGLLHGLLLGGLFKTGSLAKTVQFTTDGALARYYTVNTWRNLAQEYFEVEDILITGLKTDVFPMPAGRLKNALMAAVPDGVTRFLTNQCKMGCFLVSKLVKK